jgi:hypothetical protein
MGVTFTSRDPKHVEVAPAVQPAAGVDAMARAERVMEVRDSAPARPLSQITMHVDAGNGTTDRVHVAMRGDSLAATIHTPDVRAAQALSTNSEELARALSKQGVELDSLRVRTTDNSQQSQQDRGRSFERQQQQDERRQQREQRGRGK